MTNTQPGAGSVGTVTGGTVVRGGRVLVVGGTVVVVVVDVDVVVV